MTVTVWAIADLHLSFARPRDQSRYGEQWLDHPARLEYAWKARVAPQDIVLLPGDLSWARSVLNVQPDIDWVAALPGRKVLVRGNHDLWWRNFDLVRQSVLPEGMFAVQGNCFELDGLLICGTMGHVAPNDPYFQSHKFPSYQRELNWLSGALEQASERREDGKSILLLMHYPPFTSDGQPSGFTGVIQRHRPEICVYGHLHFQHEWDAAANGSLDGTCYHLVAADYIDMAPRKVWPPEENVEF